MHPTLRVALHFKRTVITALSLAVAVGFVFGWLVFRQTPAAQHPPVFCDQAHKIPFVPAEQCGGMTSCDRAFMNMGNPVPCPPE
jgi:hypothetical protein